MPSPSLPPAFLGALAPGSLVLDLGCGTGRHAQTLREAGLRVVGVDMDFDALSTARALYPSAPDSSTSRARVDYSAGHAGAIPCKDAAFDAVVCLDVLHWSADASAFEAAWREVFRVLRSGGLFYARLRVSRTREAATGAQDGWFLIDRAGLEALAGKWGAEWIVAPAGATGDPEEDSVGILLRKPAGQAG